MTFDLRIVIITYSLGKFKAPREPHQMQGERRKEAQRMSCHGHGGVLVLLEVLLLTLLLTFAPCFHYHYHHFMYRTTTFLTNTATEFANLTSPSAIN